MTAAERSLPGLLTEANKRLQAVQDCQPNDWSAIEDAACFLAQLLSTRPHPRPADRAEAPCWQGGALMARRKPSSALANYYGAGKVPGFNTLLVVVGYVSGQEPFRLLGRVSADTGEDALPDPPLTDAEMQPVAFAAKMALAKVMNARKRAERKAGR